MRVLLQATIPVIQGNEAIRQGKLERIINEVTAKVRPEATYFYPYEGNRTLLMIFDLKDTMDMPMISEPLYQELNALVQWYPILNKDELIHGLENLLGQTTARRY